MTRDDSLRTLKNRLKKLEKEAELRKEAEKESRELSKRNTLILDAAGEGIFGLNVSGNHTFVNPAAAKMLGYDVRELLGRNSQGPAGRKPGEGGGREPEPEQADHVILPLKRSDADWP